MSSNTKWQLSGSAAESYEEFLVPTIFVPWAQQLLSKSVPQYGDNILDVACGTGIVARMAKARVGTAGRVVGVDLNTSMLDVAKTLDLHGAIEWLKADVGQMPLRDEVFDTAYCQQGLQFFPDKIGALREVLRLLRCGGKCSIVVAQSLSQNPLMRSQVTALEKHIDEAAAGSIRAVCGLSEGDEIQTLFEGAGFAEVNWDTIDLTLTCDDGRAFITNGIMSTPVAGIISNWSEEARNTLVDEILSELGDYYNGRALTFPHVASIVTGTKR